MRRIFRLGLGEHHLAEEVDEELAFHLAMRQRTLIDGGLDPGDAHHEALRRFGNLQQVRTACVTLDHERERDMTRVRHLDELRQDLAFGLRTLRRNPAFAAVTVLTLALGIGAITAVFTLINAVLLRPMAVRAPEELIALGNPARINSLSIGSERADLFSVPLYRDLRDNNNAFTGLLASGATRRFQVRMDRRAGEPEHPVGRFVSGNYFNVLGISAARGRVFDGSEDATAGAAPEVVISDRYWNQRFGRSPAVVGRSILVDDVAMTVIGVTPAGFTGEIVERPTDIWVPLTMVDQLQSHQEVLDARNTSWLLLLGRLRPAMPAAQAQASLALLTHRFLIDHADARDDTTALRKAPTPFQSGATGFSRARVTYRGPLLTMLAGVGVLLLIICANVGNLLLARALARTPEISVRLAMGAGRTRLLRQLLTESVVLAVCAAVAGLGLAWVGSRALLALTDNGGTPIPLDLHADMRVLAFSVAVALITALLFGLLPAWSASRLDLASVLRARGTAAGMDARGQRFPIGRMMIAAQIALSLVLLMGAGMLVRSLQALEGTSLGLDRDHLLTLSVDTRSGSYRGAALVALSTRLTDRLRHVPGVTAVTYSENGIFVGTESNIGVDVPGWSSRNSDDSVSWSDQVGPQYSTTLGTPVLAGRDFVAADADPHGRRVALINQSFAKFYFGQVNPVGRSLRIDDQVDSATTIDIVGVIADVRDHALDAAPLRRIYTPYTQFLAGTPSNINLAIRTAGDPARVLDAARRAIAAEDPNLPVDAAPLRQLMRESISEQRLLSQVASGFGALALLLAAIGLYGVMTYAVTRRTGEIGLRIALGAQPMAMIRMVVRDALLLVLAGVVAGLPLSLVASRLLRSEAHNDGFDPATATIALAVLTTAALLAAIIPAWRASRVSPLTALGHS